MKSTDFRKYIVFRFCAVFLALLISFAPLTAVSAYADEEENSQPAVTETQEEAQEQEETAPIKSGLTEEEGKLYYYLEDGEPFKDGYKEVVVDGETKYYYFTEDGSAFTGGYKQFNKDGKRVYYYFQDDGTAYTSGYLNFELGGTQYYYYFTEDGSAFTGGYKEITVDGKQYYYYFLPNGQGYHSGYKTAMIDGVKHYFYFGSDGRAETDSLKAIPLGSRTAYFLFQNNGRAYTGGYKEISDNGKTDYYYFLPNGQAYTTGYKTVKINGTTYYFFFENDGKAFTGGLKSVKFGSESYKYFFQSNGRAYTSNWKDVNGKRCYFQANGRMAIGWTQINGNWYYMYSDGTMAADARVGGSYVNAEGIWESAYDSMLQKAQGYSSSTGYLLLVDTSACRVGVYVKNGSSWENKYYWQCAPGAASTPTVKGTFTVAAKGAYFDSGSARCFYYTQFYGNYLFHSTLYSQKSTDPAKAGEIDGTMGVPASHGCVRLKIENAKWIYDNIPKSTKVVTY